jgi:4-aminobutyrate aminotransferase-like enzyme
MADEAIRFPAEPDSNAVRAAIAATEPRSARTFTPTQAALAVSAGSFHWTPEGRRLCDFSSGVLVANLGHNPRRWWQRLQGHMGWNLAEWAAGPAFLPLPTLTAYNAVAPLQAEANRRLLASLRASPHGAKLEQILWAASGSEAVQKALWACLARAPNRQTILATRDGFHGKKGLSDAVTGNEQSPHRDPRVRFVSFPKDECRNLDRRRLPFDPAPYVAELDAAWAETAGGIAAFITEPYLGGGGSYHPPCEYLPAIAAWCAARDVPFALDEVQSNFGRTGSMYAFETYGVAPDLVVLGKGMGNGIPANAVAGRVDLFAALGYGGASDTWSGHPLGCAATLATLDIFETEGILNCARRASAVVEAGLRRLAELPIVAAVRGEGMVWGIELGDAGPDWPRHRVAAECVREAYLGNGPDGIHLLGPLAGCVLRVSPPLTITEAEATAAFELLHQCFERVAAAAQP